MPINQALIFERVALVSCTDVDSFDGKKIPLDALRIYVLALEDATFGPGVRVAR
jgi:hypothetical protein